MTFSFYLEFVSQMLSEHGAMVTERIFSLYQMELTVSTSGLVTLSSHAPPWLMKEGFLHVT